MGQVEEESNKCSALFSPSRILWSPKLMQSQGNSAIFPATFTIFTKLPQIFLGFGPSYVVTSSQCAYSQSPLWFTCQTWVQLKYLIYLQRAMQNNFVQLQLHQLESYADCKAHSGKMSRQNRALLGARITKELCEILYGLLFKIFIQKPQIMLSISWCTPFQIWSSKTANILISLNTALRFIWGHN